MKDASLTLAFLREEAASRGRYRAGWDRIFGPKKSRRIVDRAPASEYKHPIATKKGRSGCNS